jgi:hypothetical protein
LQRSFCGLAHDPEKHALGLDPGDRAQTRISSAMAICPNPGALWSEIPEKLKENFMPKRTGGGLCWDNGGGIASPGRGYTGGAGG